MIKQSEILSEHLLYLKLAYIKENFIDAANKAAKKKITHLDFLADLIEDEVAEKRKNAVDVAASEFCSDFSSLKVSTF